ncbi:hypothetical protein GLOIN_2v1779384 [Rhizophagus irregularis DAOM 181602=DAOM 197198]|nr:hypothetical protein GLOIN_2v1779384 [Rhizophagus irregularis DAOM 181602=DAOM 197198]
MESNYDDEIQCYDKVSPDDISDWSYIDQPDMVYDIEYTGDDDDLNIDDEKLDAILADKGNKSETKGFIHIDLVNLFTSYRILNKDRIRLLDGLVNKLIFDFKIFIWEYRNVKLVDLEHQKEINVKMKKSVNKSKLVANKLDKIVSSRWEL